jgi:hypothetical protein
MSSSSTYFFWTGGVQWQSLYGPAHMHNLAMTTLGGTGMALIGTGHNPALHLDKGHSTLGCSSNRSSVGQDQAGSNGLQHLAHNDQSLSTVCWVSSSERGDWWDLPDNLSMVILVT